MTEPSSHPEPLLPASGTTSYQFTTDANGRPITELYRRLHETAVEISSAVPDPAQWTHLVIYLVASLENQRKGHHAVESTLEDICRLITRRMNRGEWNL